MAEKVDGLEEVGRSVQEVAVPANTSGGVSEGGKKVNGSVLVSSPCSPSALSPKIDCKSLAHKLLAQPVAKSRQEQWGLLTALSEKARKRTQGAHIVLHQPEHVLGRTVADGHCQFESPAVSGRHCTVIRRVLTSDGLIKPFGRELSPGDQIIVCVKDSSSNGTYINNQRLRKNGPELRLQHGDILSMVAMSEQENAFAFVYRECNDDSARQLFKRKTPPSETDHEPVLGDGKRIRGITSSSEGPVSLDDVRRLQRANEELRQKLEEHVLSIEKLRGEMRAAEARHQVEVKEIRAAITSQYVAQVEELQGELTKRNTELEEGAAIRIQQQSSIEDLTQRLSAAAQSRVDAEEAIESHKSSISELEKRLEEEREKQEKERSQAEVNLQAAVERVRAEALEEQKRHSETAARLQKEQQEMITDLQETDKENRRLAENLRTKLEAERQVVVSAEEKGRRLEALLQEERSAKDSARKKVVEIQDELRRVNSELENEKTAKDTAKAKIDMLELEMETAIRDLTLEKQRLQGARERIVLRETQLRAFHSTAAEIEALQQIQQEQLKAMLRTLEDNDEEDAKPKQTEIGNHEADGENNQRNRRTEVAIAVAKIKAQNRFETYPDVSTKPEDSTGGTEADNDPDDEVVSKSVPRDGAEWIVGDTQEEEDCLGAIGGPLNLRRHLSDAVAVVRDSKETCHTDSGTKVVNSHEDNTQLYENAPLDVTQMIDQTMDLADEGRTKLFSNGRRSGGQEEATESDRKEGDYLIAASDSGADGRDDEAEDDKAEGIGGETMQIDDPVGTVVADTEGELNQVLDDTLQVDPVAHIGFRFRSRNKGDIFQTVGEASVHRGLNSGNVVIHAGGSPVSGLRALDVAGEIPSTRRDSIQDNTICTEDLLASEVAGSWAVSHGTQASVHGDNESSGSDERGDYGEEVQHSTEEGASQVAASIVRDTDPRPGRYYNVRLDEVLHLADPINSQNSLSPATTNVNREEGIYLDDILKYAPKVETRLGRLGSPSRAKYNASDTDDGSDEDEAANKDEGVSSDEDGDT